MLNYISMLVKGPNVISMIMALLLVQGCTTKLVADYDAELAQEIINVSKQVDRFYGELIETSAANRSYDKFKNKYIEIEKAKCLETISLLISGEFLMASSC